MTSSIEWGKCGKKFAAMHQCNGTGAVHTFKVTGPISWRQSSRGTYYLCSQTHKGVVCLWASDWTRVEVLMLQMSKVSSFRMWGRRSQSQARNGDSWFELARPGWQHSDVVDAFEVNSLRMKAEVAYLAEEKKRKEDVVRSKARQEKERQEADERVAIAVEKDPLENVEELLQSLKAEATSQNISVVDRAEQDLKDVKRLQTTLQLTPPEPTPAPSPVVVTKEETKEEPKRKHGNYEPRTRIYMRFPNPKGKAVFDALWDAYGRDETLEYAGGGKEMWLGSVMLRLAMDWDAKQGGEARSLLRSQRLASDA